MLVTYTYILNCVGSSLDDVTSISELIVLRQLTAFLCSELF